MEKELSSKQLELLMLIWPVEKAPDGTIIGGSGLSITEAAKILDIKVSAAYQRLRDLKKHNPEVYDKFKKARQRRGELRKKIHSIKQYHLGSDLYNMEAIEDKIKEKF